MMSGPGPMAIQNAWLFDGIGYAPSNEPSTAADDGDRALSSGRGWAIPFALLACVAVMGLLLYGAALALTFILQTGADIHTATR